jgi:hypothetical protein
MGHLHYSPYQWATAVQASEGDVSAKRILAVNKKLTRKDKIKTDHLKSTLTRAEAHEICYNRSPNAFISPNSVGGMRDIKSVFGC